MKSVGMILFLLIAACWFVDGYWLDAEPVTATVHKVGAVLAMGICWIWLTVKDDSGK